MLNVESIKRKISKAIDNAPTTVTFSRDIWEEDGVGGRQKLYTENYYDIVGLLDNSSGTSYNRYRADGGKRDNMVQATFYTVCNDNYTPQLDDYFELDGVKYKVSGMQDILNLHIYWNIILDMEV